MARKYTLSEMKEANRKAHHFFFQPGYRKFGPLRAAYDEETGTNWVVVLTNPRPREHIPVWYKFDARNGHLKYTWAFAVPIPMRVAAERALLKRGK